MNTTNRSAPTKKRPTAFYCKHLERDVQAVECVDDYVNANSLQVKHSPCYRCPVGLKQRMDLVSR